MSVDSRVSQYSEKFGQLVMKFDLESMALREYGLGPLGKPIIFLAQFKNLRVNKKISPDHFFYRVPDNVKVVDITEELVTRLK